MSQSFIGGYFLNPYIQRFEDALNLAAHDSIGSTPSVPSTLPYTLIRTGNVGYTVILLFARDPSRLRDIQEAEVGFGAAEMGNKGAVGLRGTFSGDGGEEGEFTFVATHLAAMEWNLARRNSNWAAIVRGLTFGNPEELVKAHIAGDNTPPEGERVPLLQDVHDEQHLRLARQLHDISVFKPSSHLFVGGDLNYRISTTSPPAGASFPSLDPESENHYPAFFSRDQLTREREAGRTMHGLSEAEVNFPPTYKLIVKPGKKDGEVDWKFAPHRYPSWTDRVLYLDTPSRCKHKVDVKAYDAMPAVATSDHRPVFLRASIPLIAPSCITSNLDTDDPRARLPLEIDPEAWERRKAIRRRELMVGWSAFLWSTREGAVILGTVVVVGVGWWWLSQPANV